MENEEFDLSNCIEMSGFIQNVPVVQAKYLQEFIEKEENLLKLFLNTVLNPNNKSKEYIETLTFEYDFNEFCKSRRKLIGDKLNGKI